ncbi:ribosomal protein L7/L12 [Streptomyces chattanoogensis]|uniref:ribosomal protein L7/L12 n=1 Tax=Streptomyces chattanoogensis TaxID=66876 RepID=UPI00247FE78F|nr:ribosomal protein L7/L12 [Streptomyces chattanoogensis]
MVLEPDPWAVEVMKVLHRLTGLSLWHSKILTRDVPADVLEEVSEESATASTTMLRDAGALAEVRRQPTSPGQ